MQGYDVIALGELLIDFTENGYSSQGNPLLEANPGGAPCNVLAMLQRLGKQTAFIGKVGNDAFGHMLKAAIEEQGIYAGNLVMDPGVPTTLAFVHTGRDGDRSFSFYRNPGADMMLRQEEIEFDLIRNTKIFHFGTLSMTEPEISSVTKKAVETAKEAGKLISFDPNLRPALWKNLRAAKDSMEYGFAQCDILKISDDEITFFTGEKDIDAGIRVLRQSYPVPLVCATMGRGGSKVYCREYEIFCPSFLREDTIETTGAGDTFTACILNGVLEHGMEKLSENDLAGMLKFANAAAALITTRKGALRVMPKRQEVEALAAAR